MIEILDKINNTCHKVPFLEFAVHPLNGQVTNIKEMEQEYIEEGMKVSGVIFKEDGTTMVLYKKIN